MHDLQTEVAKTGTELREAVSSATTAQEAAERAEADLRAQLSVATAQAEQLNNQLLSVKAAAVDSHLAERNSRYFMAVSIVVSTLSLCTGCHHPIRHTPHNLSPTQQASNDAFKTNAPVWTWREYIRANISCYVQGS